MNDFSIGSATWPGISKLVEEAGEVQQICGKLIGMGGNVKHWDGSDLKIRLQEETADLIAACMFVWRVNKLDDEFIDNRIARKIERFFMWHLEGGPAAQK